MRTLILNLWPSDHSPGQEAGLREILEGERHETVHVLPGSLVPTPPMAAAEFLTGTLRDFDPQHVVVLASAHSLVAGREGFASLIPALCGRTVSYWEGDAWGRGKPMSPTMARWMARSDHLFHTGGVLQPERFASTRTLVHLTPNAYCHIRFSEQERNAPPDDHAYDVAMIGNNVTRLPIPVPGLTGLPGGLPRWRLARTLAHTLGPDKFLLLGRDWPSRWSPGTVPFEGQAQALRSALVSVNWDHYSSYPAYSSDRLPIALIAGRPHVTTGHPGMDWAPDRSHGLFLEPDVAAVSRTALALASQPDRARSLGLAAWEWARHRISTREQARFMLSRMRPDIAEPPTDPWLSLPAPVAGSARDDWPR